MILQDYWPFQQKDTLIIENYIKLKLYNLK